MREPNLNKFFSGNLTQEEKLYLKNWLDKDPAHQKKFLTERKLYNLTILNANKKSLLTKENSSKTVQIKRLLLQFSKVAAIFFLAFIFYYYIDKNTSKQLVEEMAYQTINVPFGQRVNLDLPDGSKVCLNAGTTIKYPVSFNNKVREVIVEGEAYFEINKKTDLPFRVLAGNHTVEVLGTKFNVEVDISENRFETALFEGSVKVVDHSFPDKSVELEPNTTVYLKEGILQVEPIAFPDRYNWREGILCFEKERFNNIMNVFEKSYGCKIIVKNKNLDRYLYTGKFLQTDGVDYALSLLQKNVCFIYSRDKDTNTIVID